MSCRHTVDIIVPVYNEENNIKQFVEAIQSNVCTIDAEFNIIFVDDGSKDRTLKEIKSVYNTPTVKGNNLKINYIAFVKNYGKEAAMLAGLRYSTSDYVMFMDVDLQDPPDLIYQMYSSIVQDKVDIVRVSRCFTSTSSDIFCRICGVPEGLRDFSIFSKEVKERLLHLNTKNRFTRYMLYKVCGSEKVLYYDYISRSEGESKWSFRSLLSYAVDGIFELKRNSFIYCVSVINLVALIVDIIISFILPIQYAFILLGVIILEVSSVLIVLVDRVLTEVRDEPSYFVREMSFEKLD